MWYSLTGWASVVSPLINYGIGHIHAALSPWKYMYIVAGCKSSSLVGFSSRKPLFPISSLETDRMPCRHHNSMGCSASRDLTSRSNSCARFRSASALYSCRQAPFQQLWRTKHSFQDGPSVGTALRCQILAHVLHSAAEHDCQWPHLNICADHNQRLWIHHPANTSTVYARRRVCWYHDADDGVPRHAFQSPQHPNIHHIRHPVHDHSCFCTTVEAQTHRQRRTFLRNLYLVNLRIGIRGSHGAPYRQQFWLYQALACFIRPLRRLLPW